MNVKWILLSAALLSLGGLFFGCNTYSGDSSVRGSVYYGYGWHDPWYYGGYDNDIIVQPPPRPERPDRPDRPSDRPRPSHPIVRPAPSPRPLPSIPSRPRGGGGGRRR